MGMGSGPVRAEKQQTQAQKELSEEEQRQVEELKRRDAEVRAHEAAHMAAGSGLVRGGASYEYEQGPDGKRYAVGGEVSIDTSPVRGDPEATLAKAQKIRNAALAPADPSSQDRSVAAQASQMAAEARMEMAKQRQEGGDLAPANMGLAASGNKADIYSSIQNDRDARPALLDMFL
ncbi:MAG: hypothetical protein H7842_05385 [Gammaproteobacteria bacterium SHHR-1]